MFPHIFHIFLPIPSYFVRISPYFMWYSPHIASYFPHTSSYSFIFSTYFLRFSQVLQTGEERRGDTQISGPPIPGRKFSQVSSLTPTQGDPQNFTKFFQVPISRGGGWYANLWLTPGLNFQGGGSIKTWNLLKILDRTEIMLKARRCY